MLVTRASWLFETNRVTNVETYSFGMARLSSEKVQGQRLQERELWIAGSNLGMNLTGTYFLVLYGELKVCPCLGSDFRAWNRTLWWVYA